MDTKNPLTELHRAGQSPWLDNLKREYLLEGKLQELVDAGVRGVTSNPTIFQKAIASGKAYDEQFAAHAGAGAEAAYWEMVVQDVEGAAEVLAPVHEESGGVDGWVSVEVDPRLADDEEGTVRAARELRGRIQRPNVLVKVPATDAGVAAIRRLVAEGMSVNVTLIFGLERYEEVIEAYLAGLEEREGDLSGIHSVASFFVSRVDTLVDRLLEEDGSEGALALRGKVALAQARAAHALAEERFSGERWERLRERGANVQRPLWASTSVKNPEYPELLYVEELVLPGSVNTMPEPTLERFRSDGEARAEDGTGREEAREVLSAVEQYGVDLQEVAATLETEGVESFKKSFEDLHDALEEKARALQ